MTAPRPNLFAASASTPAVSFKNAPIGTTIVLDVTGYPESVHGTDFETGNKEYWPDGNPKMSIVVAGTVNGVEHSLWVRPGTSMFDAIGKAQEAAGAEVSPGGRLAVTFVGEVPSSKGPHLNPAKQYTAVYSPGNAFAGTADRHYPVLPVPAAAALGQAMAAAPAAAPTGKPVTAEQYAALANAGVDMQPFVIV